MVFWGVMAKIFGGNTPKNAMADDLRRLVKNCGYAPNTVVCIRSAKKLQKKTLKNGMSTP